MNDTEGEAPKGRRGTFWDWPVGVIIAGVVLGIATGGATGAVVLFWFGVIALMIRRGAFTPRRKD